MSRISHFASVRPDVPVGLFTVLVACVLAFVAPAMASADVSVFEILINRDQNPTTGCDVTTVDGVFEGVEQILTTTVETDPTSGTVTGVERRECTGAVFGPPIPVDAGGWDVGVGLGQDGSDVIETYLPLAALGSGPDAIRLGVASMDEDMDEDALLTANGGPTAGPPIILVLAQASVLEIPTASEWGLLLLALLLLLSAMVLLRHRGATATLLALVLLVGSAGVLWAGTLDGNPAEWNAGDLLAEDAAFDAAEGADIVALYGMVDGSEICFRIDAHLQFPPANTAPTAVDDAYATDEDTALAVPAPGVLANDTDPDSDPLTVTDHDPTSAEGAVVNVAADGSFTYDPTGVASLQTLDDGEVVADTFTYTISDGTVTDMATVTVTVSGANDAPTAMDDIYETDEDTPLVIMAPGVLVNDDDVDASDSLTAVLDTTTANGTLTLNPDGSFTYTPDMDFNGVDTFTYRASDGTATSNLATATITVGAVNDGPNAVDDSFMTDEDTALMEPLPGVLTNDTDPEMDMLTVTGFDATSVQGGSVSVAGDGSFTYTPPADFDGVDTFDYTVSDGIATDTATVTVTVAAVNDPPTAADDAYSTDEDTALNVAAPGVLDNDDDADGDMLTAVLVSGPSNAAAFTLNADGSFDYTPAPNFEGVDSFTYRANDGTVNSNLATVTITVDAVNDLPVADDETFDAVCNIESVVEMGDQTAEPTGVVFRTVADNVLAGDSDPVEMDPVSIVSATGMATDSTGPEYTVTTAEGGTVTLHPDGSFTYTPEGGDRSVADSFTYTIQDPDGGQDTATVTLNVGSTCVWFVDNAVNPTDGDGDGTSSDPFSSLVDETAPDALPDDAEDAALAGDIVYVFEGAGGYEGDYTALQNQRILGQGVDLVVDLGGGDETLFAGNPANRPLVDASDDGFTVGDITGVEIAGFEVDAVDHAFAVSSVASPVGVLIRDNVVTGAGSEAIDINQTVAGDSFVVLMDNTIAATGNAIRAGVTAGNLEVAIDGNDGITSTGDAIVLDGTGGGNLFISSLCGNSVLGTTAGDAIQVLGAVFDADPSDPDFTGDQVTCGAATALGTMADPVDGSGLVLDGVRGDLNLGQLDIHAGTAGGLDETGLRVVATGAFDAGTGTGFRLTTSGGTVRSIDGPALDIAPTTLAMVLTDIVSENSGTVGVSLVEVAGSLVTNGGGSNITGAVGNAFEIVDSPASLAVTYDGDITNGSAATLLVDNHPAGTVTFSGGTLGATGGTGLQFDNADGTYQITSTATLNGGDAGVDIVNGSDGGFTFSDTDVTSPTGPGIRVADSAPSSVVFAGGSSLTYATAAQPAVLLQNRGGGAFTFSGQVNATDGTGLQFNNNDGSMTTFNNSVTLDGGDAGVDIVNGSSGSYTFSNTTITNPTGVAFNVDSSSGAITYSAGGITQTNAAAAVRLNSHGGGIVNLSAPIAGNTGVANAVELTGTNAGVYNFRGGLDLDTTTGIAFNATGGGNGVNVCSDTACNGSGTGLTNTVDVSGAAFAGINFVNTVIGASGVTFSTVNVNGAADGINLTNAGSGSFAALGGTIQNVTDRGVDVSGGTGDIRVDASIDTTTLGRSVEVTTHTGGTVDFNGFIDDDGIGVRLASNPGAVLRFDGGMDIDTAATSGTEEGFEATGGGTLHVTGTNTVDTSLATGIAVLIENTTIGADDVTFRTVSANGGGNAGIVLDTTGIVGSFAVTGDGGAANNGSGGSIINKTGDAVYLESTMDASLAYMNIGQAGALGNIDDNGVRAHLVDGLTLHRVNFRNVADQASPDEAALFATEPRGLWNVTNSLFDRSFDDHIRVDNSTTTSGFIFNLLDSTLQDNDASGNGNDGFLYTADGGNTDATINIRRNLFDDSDGDHIQVVLAGAASATVEIGGAAPADGNNLGATPGTVLGSGITLSSGTDSLANGFQGLLTYLIQNNDIQHAGAEAINVNLSVSSTAGLRYDGTISDNTVGTSGTALSGGFGIGVTQNGAGTLDAVISGNIVSEFDGDHGMLLEARDGSGRLNAVVTGNTVSDPADGAVFDGLGINAGATGTDTSVVCADISGNSLVGTGPSGADFAIFSANSAPGGTQVIIPGYAGGAKDNAAIVAFVQGQNDANPADPGIQAPAPSGTTFFAANSQGATGVGSCN